MPAARFDIAEIQRSLEQTRFMFEGASATSDDSCGPMTSEAIANMVEGYRFVDQLLARGENPLAMGNSKLLLEINTLVLCGSGSGDRASFSLHIEQTARKFYDDEQGGIGSLMEWFGLHKHDNIWRRIAGLYIQVTSRPQLFIEGNHRSAILIASYILGQEGYPPFVLTPANAKALLDQSPSVSDLNKHGFSALIQIPRLCGQLATIFREGLEQRHSLGALSVASE
jgi:hypothetical protein